MGEGGICEEWKKNVKKYDERIMLYSSDDKYDADSTEGEWKKKTMTTATKKKQKTLIKEDNVYTDNSKR